MGLLPQLSCNPHLTVVCDLCCKVHVDKSNFTIFVAVMEILGAKYDKFESKAYNGLQGF